MKILLSVALLISLTACAERATRVKVEGGIQPDFIFSGSGDLGGFTVSGSQDDPRFPDGHIWTIEPIKGILEGRAIADIRRIKYGVVPEGYKQVVPKDGTPPPPLIEGITYDYVPNTVNAPYTSGEFRIRNGKVVDLSNQK